MFVIDVSSPGERLLALAYAFEVAKPAVFSSSRNSSVMTMPFDLAEKNNFKLKKAVQGSSKTINYRAFWKTFQHHVHLACSHLP